VVERVHAGGVHAELVLAELVRARARRVRMCIRVAELAERVRVDARRARVGGARRAGRVRVEERAEVRNRVGHADELLCAGAGGVQGAHGARERRHGGMDGQWHRAGRRAATAPASGLTCARHLVLDVRRLGLRWTVYSSRKSNGSPAHFCDGASDSRAVTIMRCAPVVMRPHAPSPIVSTTVRDTLMPAQRPSLPISSI
jgi:hypothetical protein